ncbi:MAG: hypothetical protein U0800_00625 [Isosphaeraceae bacterium]
MKNSIKMPVASIALGAISAVVALGFSRSATIPEVLEARGFVVKDRQGNKRIEISCNDKNESVMNFLDKNGKEFVKIGINDAEQSFVSFTHKDKISMTIGCNASGDPVIAMFDADNNGRLVLQTPTDGEPHILLLDKHGFIKNDIQAK